MQGAVIPLLYPSDDPLAAKAMIDLAAQVKEAIGVTLELTAMPSNELRDAVERDHTYSLAYYHYDFPDDVYWLGPLLDSVNDKKENLLQYQGSLSDMVKDLSRRRDFTEVRPLAQRCTTSSSRRKCRSFRCGSSTRWRPSTPTWTRGRPIRRSTRCWCSPAWTDGR